MTAKDNSFNSGDMTFDYDYMTQATPHHELVQTAVRDAVLSYSAKQCHRKLNALEIGTGTGITSKLVLEAVPTIHVTCLDISKNMLDQARKKFTNSGLLDRVSFVQEDALKELERTSDEKYDLAFSAYTLHNMHENERRRLLPKIYRVLKTGGEFILSDKLAANDPVEHSQNLVWYFDALSRFFPPERKSSHQEFVDHTNFDEQPGQRWVEAQALHDFYDAGFKQINSLYRVKMEAGFSMIK